jgi:E3 ubiquitin-protein ligase BRE1
VLRAKATEAEKLRDDAIANASKEAEKAITESGGGTAADMDALRQRLSKAEAINKSQKEEEEGLVQELDEIGQAFEEMQTQNAKLLAQLKEKDDENFRLMSSRVKDTTKQTVLEDAARARDIKLLALENKVGAQAEALQKITAAEAQAQDEIKKLKGENEAARQLAEQCRAAQQLSNEKLVELKTIFDIADKQRKELQTVSEASTQEKHKEAGRASKLQT